MPFGMVSGIGRGMGVLDGWLSSKGRGSFGLEFGASQCNHADFAIRLFPNYVGQDPFKLLYIFSVCIFSWYYSGE